MTYNIPNGSMLIFIFLLQAAIIQSGLKLQETQSPFGAEFLNIFLVCHSFQRCALQKSLHHYFGNTCPDLQGPLSLKFGCQLVVHFLPINTNSHPLSLNFVGICESFQRADDRGKIETISLSLSKAESKFHPYFNPMYRGIFTFNTLYESMWSHCLSPTYLLPNGYTWAPYTAQWKT